MNDRNDWVPPNSDEVSEMERLQLEEAIQLSLALEASRQEEQRLAYRGYQNEDVNIDAFGVSFCIASVTCCAV